MTPRITNFNQFERLFIDTELYESVITTVYAWPLTKPSSYIFASFLVPQQSKAPFFYASTSSFQRSFCFLGSVGMVFKKTGAELKACRTS
jgi:hypothetical protein